MTGKIPLVERAYQLARTAGARGSIEALVKQLKVEQYEATDSYVSGSLRVELRKIILAGRSAVA